MRSSKSRSRSKQNRPRSIGNIVNRVFDSSGPEGKVRGTPQQIIEKYQTLARDAQLSNDRVAAENFLQHSEHYTRMLGEAMRELAVEQEARRQNQGGNGNGQHGQDRQPYGQRRDDRAADGDQPDVPAPAFGFSEEETDSGLVETPEARAEQPRQDRRREDQPKRERDDRRRDDRRRDDRRPAPVAEVPVEPVAEAGTPAVVKPAPKPRPVAVPAEAEAPAATEGEDKPKRARAPRKPRASAAKSDAPASEPAGSGDSPEAAE